MLSILAAVGDRVCSEMKLPQFLGIISFEDAVEELKSTYIGAKWGCCYVREELVVRGG
jgi:hypothetical protein